jgi:hypothetical protein
MGTDFIFIKNSLQTDASTNTNSLFYQHLTTTSAYMGHSMGGGASYLAAQNDPTVTALVGLAPAVTNPSSIDAAAQINKPAIIFSGAADPVTTPESSHIPIYDSLKSDCKVFVSITGGGHCYFANAGSVCEFGEAGGNFSISREEQQTITNSLLTPWLGYWLKGDALSITMFNQVLNSETGITHTETCPLLTTGVKEDAFSAVQVFPNPAKSTIYIKSSNIATMHYKLINSMGAEVSFGNLTTETGSINTANLSAGIYSIIITQGNQSKSYRIILE